MSVVTPADTGGTPAVMPTNDWWKEPLLRGIEAVRDYQIARVQLAQQPRSTIAPFIDSNAETVNRPPGQSGLNAPAATTPGGVARELDGSGRALGSGSSVTSLVLVVALAAVGAVLLVKVLR